MSTSEAGRTNAKARVAYEAMGELQAEKRTLVRLLTRCDEELSRHTEPCDCQRCTLKDEISEALTKAST
jgi:hypothetical protein